MQSKIHEVACCIFLFYIIQKTEFFVRHCLAKKSFLLGFVCAPSGRPPPITSIFFYPLLLFHINYHSAIISDSTFICLIACIMISIRSMISLNTRLFSHIGNPSVGSGRTMFVTIWCYCYYFTCFLCLVLLLVSELFCT